MSGRAQHCWVPSGYLRCVKRHPTRIPCHPTAPSRIPRHSGEILGTRLHLSEPQSPEHLNRPQDSISDGRISQDSTASDGTRQNSSSPAKFPSPETLGGDLKFRQNSFSPHRLSVARDSRRLPLS